MTQTQIAYMNAMEQAHYNFQYISEMHHQHEETNRHNRVLEDLQRQQQLEQARHNVETEGLSARDVTVKEGSLQETIRSNLASEGIRREANAINMAAVAETAKHNRASEQLQAYANIHQVEHNREMETLQAVSNDETERANKAREKYYALEALTGYGSLLLNQEKFGHQMSQDAFYRKISLAETSIKGVNAASNLVGSLADVFK